MRKKDWRIRAKSLHRDNLHLVKEVESLREKLDDAFDIALDRIDKADLRRELADANTAREELAEFRASDILKMEDLSKHNAALAAEANRFRAANIRLNDDRRQMALRISDLEAERVRLLREAEGLRRQLEAGNEALQIKAEQCCRANAEARRVEYRAAALQAQAQGFPARGVPTGHVPPFDTVV